VLKARGKKLSQEKSFYTLALIEESERAYALVKAAIEKEEQGEYQEAQDIYQKVLNEFGRCLFRVSDYGVFVPAAHDGSRLALTDGFYCLMVDVEKMRVVWKRLIDANDPTRLPPLRMEMKGDYLAVVKQDFDVKAIYRLASGTGDVLWRTDPKVPGCPQPISSMFIQRGRLYGIKPHPGRGFYFVGMDCKTGKNLFAFAEQTGYGGRPECTLRHEMYGNALVVAVRNRQDFELRAFDASSGRLLHTVGVKGTGTFGEHGGASATVQNARLILRRPVAATKEDDWMHSCPR